MVMPSGRRSSEPVPVPKASGKAPQISHYVTDSGYMEPEDARTYVGRADPAPQSLLLLDLQHHQVYPLKTAGLPAIKDDPLAADISQIGEHEESALPDSQAWGHAGKRRSIQEDHRVANRSHGARREYDGTRDRSRANQLSQ